MSWEYTGETSWEPREKGVNEHDFNCIFGSLASGPSAFFGLYNTSVRMRCTGDVISFQSWLRVSVIDYARATGKAWEPRHTYTLALVGRFQSRDIAGMVHCKTTWGHFQLPARIPFKLLK